MAEIEIEKKLILQLTACILGVDEGRLLQDPTLPLQYFSLVLLPATPPPKHWTSYTMFTELFKALSAKSVGKRTFLVSPHDVGKMYYAYVTHNDIHWITDDMACYLEAANAAAPPRKGGSTSATLAENGYYIGERRPIAAFQGALDGWRKNIRRMDPSIPDVGSTLIISDLRRRFQTKLMVNQEIVDAVSALNEAWKPMYMLRLTKGKLDPDLKAAENVVVQHKKQLGFLTFCFLHMELTGQPYQAPNPNHLIHPAVRRPVQQSAPPSFNPLDASVSQHAQPTLHASQQAPVQPTLHASQQAPVQPTLHASQQQPPSFNPFDASVSQQTQPVDPAIAGHPFDTAESRAEQISLAERRLHELRGNPRRSLQASVSHRSHSRSGTTTDMEDYETSGDEDALRHVPLATHSRRSARPVRTSTIPTHQAAVPAQ